MTKKKWLIGIGGLIAVIVVIFGVLKVVNGNAPKAETSKSLEDEYGIEYFEVPDVEQVYINGIVQPNQMEAFSKDTRISGEPTIKVNHGDVVEEGTVLYVYEDKEVTKELEELNNQLSRNYTKRENVLVKWQRAIDNYNNASAEEQQATGGTLDEQYQSEIDSVDEEIFFINKQLNDLSTKQHLSTTAKFKGRVSIPEVKEENTPILTLTSDGFYVSGKVNEKDLPKIAVDKPAEITVISNNIAVKGKISYIDDNPLEGDGEMQSQEGSGGSMSNYGVKLTLESTEGIKNGYHVQATINLEDKQVEIPTKAIKEDGDKKYVLVNDFGSVIRRELQLGEAVGENTIVVSGIESADRIIVTSKKAVKEGDILDEKASEEKSSPSGNEE
ncbi:efflux RND transporter periplasmic adaptor subunit [Vagococcus elongatus]|uniref:RND transporter n=1 Tax=Vagococcus elongatus TaxID=180344 RepID=A0A430AZL8_9ENTE|nr:efflux RND transporter periplasmic adaptor subunit [Vagococcus elongatus]RSU13494.1 RND transporter [Vagococcus elongatus]